MTATGYLFIIIGVLSAGIAVIYNLLVRKRQMTDNGWADIDVQLKRRADLIPQLVTTVKGYAAHERALFDEIVERRNAALAAGESPAARSAAEHALTRPVGRLVALAEDYPDLKANTNFLALQRELADTEDKIEMARRFYNGAVRELNTMIRSFPSNLVASLFGFSGRDYFEATEGERAAPKLEMGR